MWSRDNLQRMPYMARSPRAWWLVLARTRGPGRKCLLIHAEASFSRGGQGESMVPPYPRGSVSLSLSHLSCMYAHAGHLMCAEAGAEGGDACSTQVRARAARCPVCRQAGGNWERALDRRCRAKAWCLLIHAQASLSLAGAKAKAWCFLMHAEASLSHGGQAKA